MKVRKIYTDKEIVRFQCDDLSIKDLSNLFIFLQEHQKDILKINFCKNLNPCLTTRNIQIELINNLIDLKLIQNVYDNVYAICLNVGTIIFNNIIIDFKYTDKSIGLMFAYFGFDFKIIE